MKFEDYTTLPMMKGADMQNKEIHPGAIGRLQNHVRRLEMELLEYKTENNKRLLDMRTKNDRVFIFFSIGLSVSLSALMASCIF